MALEDCVVCCPSLWQGASLRGLIESMGGRYSDHMDSHVTQVVTAHTGSHRYKVALANYPETPMVHPAWLWACYWSGSIVQIDRYRTDFYAAAQRTGTCTSYGTRAIFYRELMTFHAVEEHVLPHGIRGHCMAGLIRESGFDTESPYWPFVCRMLQHTVFWGSQVRQVNWTRRGTLMMCLVKGICAPPRPAKRACRYGGCADAPVLRRLACLPTELQRVVMQFV